MARGNLGPCLAITLVHEGGYVDHPADPGGATNMGITFKVLQRWMGRKITKQDVKNLTLSQAKAIYQANYWDQVNGERLPYGVDLATFDAGVNSGPARGAKWLQRAVGAKQDGKVGDDTLRRTGAQSGDFVVRQICKYRLSFVQGLGTFKVFGKGWSRRIADIEAKGVAMFLRYGAGMTAGAAADKMADYADEARGDAAQNGKAAAGAGVGGSAVGVGDAVTGSGWLWVIVVVAIVGAILLVLRSRQNVERAKAYEAAVAGLDWEGEGK